MKNDIDANFSSGMGRSAARAELMLAPKFDATLQRMAIPNGFIFSAWIGLVFLLWASGIIGIFYLRGQPAVQFLLSILLGSLLHTFTILQHDCGHRSAYQSQTANLWVGRFLAWFIFLPFTTFTELHRWHHGFLGEKGKDPDEWFYEGGSAQLFLRECLFMPRFIYLSLTGFFASKGSKQVVRELLFNGASYALLVTVLIFFGAIDILFFCILLPMFLLAFVYNPISRGYEHYPMACLPEDDIRRQDLRFNTITVTSRVFGFIWANITYHVEHHMYPRVPFYRLRALHKMFAGKHYLLAPYPLFKFAQPSGEGNFRP